MSQSHRLCRIVVIWAAWAITAHGEDWPQFRGADGQGHSEATDLPVRWSEQQNVIWKTPIPGLGWSSPVIEGNQIWMTAAHATEVNEQEKERRLASNTGSQPLSVCDHLSMRAVCVDRATGKLLHDIELMTKDDPDPIHTLNTFASPTPVIEGGRLYCHFGANGTACLDTTSGEVLWTNQELAINHENGAGSTPIVWGEHLIFHCDGSDVQYVVALDKQNGNVAWKTPRSGKMNDNPQLKKAYGTPLVIEVNGRPQLISPGADWLYAYDPDSGKELWKLNYGVLGFSIVPRPVAGHGMIYMCTSFMRSQLLGIGFDEGGQAKIVWRYDKQAPQQPSPLLVGDEIYIVSDKTGIAACLDAHTGEEIWRERLGGNFSASPLYADGKIYFFNREGETYVIQPGRTFKLLAENKLDGAMMASAPAVDHALYLRTDKALYRIEKRN